MTIITRLVHDKCYVLSIMTSIFENTVETEMYNKKTFGDHKCQFKYECGLLRKPVLR